jgi:uncharacterized protein (DUF849 family)
MRKAEKVIITTAVMGSVNVPSQSPYLPLSDKIEHTLRTLGAHGTRFECIEDLGKQIATPADARAMLALKGVESTVA